LSPAPFFSFFSSSSAPENVPGAREGAATWMDNEGNLWLFGGWGVPDFYTSPGLMNDLWKYDIATNQWTWMHGSPDKSTDSVFGTLGVAADENTPGGRREPMYWTDPDGMFW